MPSLEATNPMSFGKLIALEGDCDLITAQLCQLPPSQKVLVLSPFQDSVSQFDHKSKFDAKLFIFNVFTVLSQRLKAARSFLETNASADHPKIVFMNGATISARSICIKAICENITAGQIKSAEAIFNYLVRDGVAGLIRKDDSTDRDAGTETRSAKTRLDESKEEQMGQGSPELIKDLTQPDVYMTSELERTETYNRILCADTASFGTQDRGAEIKYWESYSADNTSSTELLSGYHEYIANESTTKAIDNLSDSGPDIKSFSECDNLDGEEKIVRTTFIVPSKEDLRLRKIIAETELTIPSPVSNSVSAVPSIPGAYLLDTEDDDDNNDPDEGSLEYSISYPPTPIITVDTVATDIAECAEKKQDGRLSPSSGTVRSNSSEKSSLSIKLGQNCKKRPLFLSELKASNFNKFNSLSTQASSLHSSQGIRSRPSSINSVFVGNENNERHIYVDKACGADESLYELYGSEDEIDSSIFELTEDLVIYFSDGVKDIILDAVLRSYQDNPYQPFQFSMPLSKLKSSADALRKLQTCCTNVDKLAHEPGLAKTTENASNSSPAVDNYRRNSNPSLGRSSITTPLISPLIYTQGQKIFTFSAVNATNAIAIHNDFRKLLGHHLPAGEKGYSQYYQAVSVDIDRFWKPVFDTWDTSESNPEKPTIQIIAFGTDEMVEDAFKAQISGLIQQIGIKKSGECRSSKIDISFMISNVMQNTNLLSFGRNNCEPFSKPPLIASLLVPQFEAYFASTPSSHLLILHYSSLHLPVVYALRDLFGSSILRIAGVIHDPIIKSTISSSLHTPLIIQHSEGAIDTHKSFHSQSFKGNDELECNKPSVTISSPKSASTISELDDSDAFYGVDYLLLNTATPEEITNFICDIRKPLIEKSNFYQPESEPDPKIIVQVVEKLIPTPIPTPTITPNYSLIPKLSSPPPSVKEDTLNQEKSHVFLSKLASRSGRHNNTASLATPLADFISKRNYATSIASSRLTYASSVSADLDGWENFDIGDEDSDFDDYDRMILGSKMSGLIAGRHMFGKSREKTGPKQEIASKRKALKWLGLA